MTTIDYRPPKSLEPLFYSTNFWNVIIGPVGSAKTTACIFWLLANAARQAPGKNGLRRTRYVVSRSTYQQLKMTVLKDIQYWLGPLIQWRPSDSLVLIDQPPIYSEWYLVPLETVHDQQRLLSLQLSGAWFNEGREIPMELIYAAAGRIPRYPPASEEGVTRPFILIDSNPGEIGGPLYKFCKRAEADPAGTDTLYIHQPSGLSPKADWRKFLPENYYERLVTHATPDWIDVHVHGRWAKSKSGAGVFAETFDPEVHTAEGLEPRADALTIIGLDPGRQPGAVLTQMSHDGVLYVYREAYASNVDFKTFLVEYVRPWLSIIKNTPTIAAIDPAARLKTSASNLNPLMIVREVGLEPIMAATNDIDTRITAVDRLLTLRGRGGRPLFVLDRNACPVLYEGLRGTYRYVYKKDQATIDTRPLKQHPVSDVVDALQYVAMVISGYGAERLRHRARDRLHFGATTSSRATLDLGGWA